MIDIVSKLPHTTESIFSIMSKFSAEHNAINLSQGFPDFDCSKELISLTTHFMKKGYNQYAPMPGVLALRECIAEKVNSLYGANYNPDTEITITAGATQAIFTALAAVIRPNDEVIIFEPAYDSYAPIVKLLGGLVKPFELIPPSFEIDWATVRRMVTANTKMIIINSPHNPTGRIFTKEDIKQLTDLTKSRDLLVLSDEVYEHLVYDGKPHLSFAKYPELRERSFIVASFGKLFHNTGWKMGYCLAPAKLTTEFRKVHQFQVFSVNTPIQYAISEFLKDKSHYLQLTKFFQDKRDFFSELLSQTKFKLLPCLGSYFQCVTYGDLSDKGDIDFAMSLIKDVGVASIPVSPFYSRSQDFGVLRFCFAKKHETLERAVERLVKL